MSEYQRIILVTGSNTGIGFEIVRLLAQKGHTVYLSARNEAAGLEAQSKLKAEGLSTVKFVALDVTSAASIDAARAFIEKAEGYGMPNCHALAGGDPVMATSFISRTPSNRSNIN